MSTLTRAITTAGSALVFAAGLAVTSQAMAADGALTKNQKEGKEIAFARHVGNCLACHKIADGKEAGNIGPALIAMKARYPTKQALFKVIWDPRTKFGRGIIMPPFGAHKILTKEQIEKIVDYLYTL